MRENLIKRSQAITFEVLNADVDHITRELPGVLRPEIIYKTNYRGEILDATGIV